MGSPKKIISVVNFWLSERREEVLLHATAAVLVLVLESDLGGLVVFRLKVVCWRLGEIFGVDVVVVLKLLLIVFDVWLRVELVGDLVDVFVNDVDSCFSIDVSVASGVSSGGISVELFFTFASVLLMLEILLAILAASVLLSKGGEVEDGTHRNCAINSAKRGNSKAVIWKQNLCYKLHNLIIGWVLDILSIMHI